MTVEVRPLKLTSIRNESTAQVPGRRRVRVWGALPVLSGVVALGLAAAAPVIAHRGDLQTEVVRAAVTGLFALAALMAAVRRPGERQGLVALGGSGAAALAVFAAGVLQAHAHGTAINGGGLTLARVVLGVADGVVPVAAMHLLLGLPDGSCRLSRSAVVVGYLAGATLGAALSFVHPMPAWPFYAEAVVALTVGAVGSQRRYSRAIGLERRRMQWFGWAAAIGVEVLLVSLALRLFWGWPTRPLLVLAVALVPAAVALAMGSSRKFATHIDRILAHTVSLAGLTGVVVLVYLVILLGLGHTPTHDERTLLVLSMVSAAVSALLYGPARTRLTRYANHIVYGAREAPDTVVRTFGSRLSRAVPMDELLLQVAESLRKTLSLSFAEVWTGSQGRLERTVSVPDQPAIAVTLSPEEETVVARAGASGNAWLEVWLPLVLRGRDDSVIRMAPATHSGQVLGMIVVGRTPGADALTADDDTMLVELARQVALALHNVELDSALQASLDEVRRQADELQASRARIVAAADAARRKIERDLHDGAQQHLVALAVNVRLARQLAESDPAASAELLDQLGQGLQDAVQELRALAHGIYPPLLADRGIAEALTSAAGRAALPTEVVADGLGRFAPEEEAAVYFCCLEAMQNAGKHAGQGATITVRIWQEVGALLFEVADTGAGFDASGARGKGAGFVNMSDRVGAIGGSLSVRSSPGQGTTISGRIPVVAVPLPS